MKTTGELEVGKIGILLFRILNVTRAAEEKRGKKDSCEKYIPKEGESIKELSAEYEKRIIHAGEEVLAEIENINKSDEVINPIVLWVNKITELAQIEAEANWKLYGFERTSEDCIFTYGFRSAYVTGAYINMSLKIVTACMKMVEGTDE